MAEVNTDGGGGGKHKKKGRKSASTPRIDMTPMVDLAFLLLTFFVLTSQLTKSKSMPMVVPKPLEDQLDTNTTKIPDELAITVLLDGNKKGDIYYYKGVLKETTVLEKTSTDPKKGFRTFVLERNSKVIGKMNDLRNQYKKGNMADSTFERISGTKQYRNMDDAPFFIVKWGGNATYGNVIDMIDELKIGDVSRYALTKISQTELRALSSKTGINYPDLKPLEAPTP